MNKFSANLLCAVCAVLHVWSYFDTMLTSFDQMHLTPRFADDLPDVILKIPDPVFVVIGNHGYRSMMDNLLCNTALFTNMHTHLLLAVSDGITADYLRTFTTNASIVVIDLGGLDESSDFSSFGYKEIMYLRGLGLLDILQITISQGKTAIWIEPDMHFRQSLLTAPGLVDFSNPIVTVSLQWDYNCFCGCFIRFPPSNVSLDLYQEVVYRMNPPNVMYDSKHDQTLINEVVRDLDISVTALDPCLYRSGTFLTKGYVDDRRTNCTGVTPVMQHFNFVVGKDAKITLAKKDRGWYLSPNETACLAVE
jgi:hypothetical protein